MAQRKTVKRKRTKKGTRKKDGVVLMPASALEFVKEASKSFLNGLALLSKANKEMAKIKKSR